VRVRFLLIVASVSLLASCRDTQLPAVPGPAPAGTVQGTVVYAVPGKSELTAGAGARVSVLGTGAAATADGEGRFLVDGISRNALVIQRVDSNGLQTISSSAVKGYDLVSCGGNSYIAYSLNGDIRLRTISGSVWSGAGGGAIDFGGPPRTGYTEPYPVLLDNNPLCEAVYPSMAFVEDALVITGKSAAAPRRSGASWRARCADGVTRAGATVGHRSSWVRCCRA